MLSPARRFPRDIIQSIPEESREMTIKSSSDPAHQNRSKTLSPEHPNMAGILWKTMDNQWTNSGGEEKEKHARGFKSLRANLLHPHGDSNPGLQDENLIS